jgi:Mrp family chromosome partitioning ATPase
MLRSSETGKVVVLTSPNPGDGKTTATTWLAAVLAADDRLVLCVDADLRRPKGPSPIHPEDRAFQQGLHGFLEGRGDWRDAIGRVPSRHGDYDHIVAGDGLKPEALSGERMSRFLREARQHYDFVLLDCPSYPFVSDALVLVNNADAVLSVFRLHHSSRELAHEHLHGLAGAAPHGILINEAGVKEQGSTSRPSPARPSQTGTPKAQNSTAPQAGGSRAMRWAAAALAFALMTALLYESVVTDALSRIRPSIIDRLSNSTARGE